MASRKSYLPETDALSGADAREILRGLLCALAEIKSVRSAHGLTVALTHVADALDDRTDPDGSLRRVLEGAGAVIEI